MKGPQAELSRPLGAENNLEFILSKDITTNCPLCQQKCVGVQLTSSEQQGKIIYTGEHFAEFPRIVLWQILECLYRGRYQASSYVTPITLTYTQLITSVIKLGSMFGQDNVVQFQISSCHKLSTEVDIFLLLVC